MANPHTHNIKSIMKDIIVSDITYTVKGKTILSNVSLSVDTQDSFALLGENGSGKSTLIDIILNDIKPDKGSVHFFENPKSNFNKIGVLYDHSPLFPMLKVEESIRYFTSIYGLKYQDIEKQYFEIFEIQKIQKTLTRELSQGERKRVGILLSIIHNPDLLVLDEPFANLDPTITERIWNTLKNKNRTIFFTTHDWKKAEKQANKIGFIYGGKIVHQPQSPKQILETLPALKKVTISNTDDIAKKLTDWPYYIYDESIHVFFDEKSDLLKTINTFTSNFSIQQVDLKDAYLFHVNKMTT